MLGLKLVKGANEVLSKQAGYLAHITKVQKKSSKMLLE